MRKIIMMMILAVISSSVVAETAGTENRLGNVFKDCADCPEMVVIPSGSFEMGSNNDLTDQFALHRVTISSSFSLGRTEITQGQWRSVMGNNPSDARICGDGCPVESVSWNEVQEFIQKLNTKTGKQYRLPSEAEWEYSCRAGGRQEYCGSDNLDSVGWHESTTSNRSAHPVGRKQANAWGLYDMSGNVWELVEDHYSKNQLIGPTDGSAQQGNGARRVVRGGSWSTIPKKMSAAKRGGRDSSSRDDDVGFRLARTLGAPSTEPEVHAPSIEPVVSTPSTHKLPAQSETAVGKLKALHELYKEGVINQDDFENKKQEILRTM